MQEGEDQGRLPWRRQRVRVRPQKMLTKAKKELASEQGYRVQRLQTEIKEQILKVHWAVQKETPKGGVRDEGWV